MISENASFKPPLRSVPFAAEANRLAARCIFASIATVGIESTSASPQPMDLAAYRVLSGEYAIVVVGNYNLQKS